MSSLWRNDKTVKCWKLRKPCGVFGNKFDKIQEQLHNISCMDELLSGMFVSECTICIGISMKPCLDVRVEKYVLSILGRKSACMVVGKGVVPLMGTITYCL